MSEGRWMMTRDKIRLMSDVASASRTLNTDDPESVLKLQELLGEFATEQNKHGGAHINVISADGQYGKHTKIAHDLFLKLYNMKRNDDSAVNMEKTVENYRATHFPNNPNYLKQNKEAMLYHQKTLPKISPEDLYIKR